MRIISLVPSWTETLIESGIYPVGRTRFCIHPKDAIEKIPAVGGTKAVNWDLVKQLKPDLLILDQEENPKEFAEKEFPFWASHIQDGLSLERDLFQLSQKLHSRELESWARLAKLINQTPAASSFKIESGVLEVLNPWVGNEEVAYMIWRNPWMSISKKTYIGFVLNKLGCQVHNWSHSDKKYPEIPLLDQEDLLYLFSSEPFPFSKCKDEIKSLGLKSAIVDGEKFSWFGVRSLNFLRKALELPGTG